MRQLIFILTLILAVPFFVQAQPADVADAEVEVDSESIVIWSEGVKLQGNLFKPRAMTAGEKLPGLLLVHGWGGTKQHLNRAYAPQLASLGFVVLTFDFKGWGESNGPLIYRGDLAPEDDRTDVNVDVEHIRRVINPSSMVADARAALNYLAGERQVIADNIGIWGTSLGGGIALVTAAADDRIKAYVDQIGAVNFKGNLDMITDKQVRRWEVQRARGDIDSYPGPESAIIPALQGFPDWIYLKGFDSFAAAADLNVPTLIIDAEQEELFAREINGQLLYDTIKDRVPTRYVAYPGKHYDIYQGAPYKAALKEAQDWFVEHLKDSSEGVALYKQHCSLCHSNPGAKAPALGALRILGYDRLLDEMTNGNMQVQASAMTNAQRATLAQHLATGSKDPRSWEAGMACSAQGSEGRPTEPLVGGWGYGSHNRRYQPALQAGMTADDLPNLELAWAQGFPGTTTMRSQPVITGDTLYFGVAATSSVYAFDLASGCLKWTYRSAAPVRSALVMGRMPDSGTPILIFGDSRASVHVVSAADGSGIWQGTVKTGTASTITGTPVLHEDRLYVPISSFEVSRAGHGNYECCEDHGGVRAFDIRNGEVLWTYATTGKAQPAEPTPGGLKTRGPSGAPVWTTPAIDVQRNVLYIGTGENYSWPSTGTSDAIIALNLDTGKEEWVFQALADDVYNEACAAGFLGYPESPACPKNPGPDFDFGASVIIAKTAEGQDILLAGQKSGDVFGLDPDNRGALLWQTKLSDGTPVGGVHWGMSVENDTVFVPVSDPEWRIEKWDYSPRPGVTALDVTTGKIKWQHKATRGCELDKTTMDVKNGRHNEQWPACHYAYGFSGAATSLDGAVLAGALNGTLKAFNSDDGQVLWQFDTKKSFTSLNGVEAHGGSLDNTSIAVGGGYLVIQSGYSYFNQMPGNVLLVLKAKAQ
ncbi:MAG: alpha/beta fold hydrolase [Halioglobus sp.]